MKIRLIADFDGYYAVSRTGDVFTCRVPGPIKGLKGRWKKMKPGEVSRYGHQFVLLYRNDGTKKSKLVHHLVLETFGRPRPGNKECRHKDGNPRNNHYKNLKWGSHKRNMQDMILHGTRTRGTDHHCAKLTESVIKQARKRYDAGESQRSLAKKLGVAQSVLSRAINRKTWKHV